MASFARPARVGEVSVGSLAFLDGTVFTADAGNRVVSAVLAEDGVIRATGTDADIRGLLRSDTEVIELRGRTLVPGFIDAHCHPTMLGAGLGQVDARYPGVASVEDLARAVERGVASAEPGAWVRGWGLDHDKFRGGMPTRWEIDAVSPNNPVWVLHVGGHLALVNSEALRRAGIGDDVEDPPSGRFVRDGRGVPTGMLFDAAQKLVMRSSVDVGTHGPSTGIYDAPVEELVGQIQAAYDQYLRAGITSVVDAQTTGRELRAYIEARRQGRLRLRTTCMMLSNHLRDFQALGLGGPLGDEWLALGPMKFYADGSLPGSTAAFHEAYEHEEGFHGVAYWTPDELSSLVLEAHRLGLQVGIHAQGDRGIEAALDAIEGALIAEPREDHRHRIEHFGVPELAQVRRAARLGVLPVMNPRFIYEVGDTFWANLGPERARRVYPAGGFLREGGRVVIGSDSPVVSFEPLDQLWAAMTRVTLGGHELDGTHGLSAIQALRAQTIDAAFSIRQESRRGSIESGKLADLAVIDGALLEATQDEIRQRSVEMTVIGGEVVWRA
jgi:predicted amidohydrolase YtcJ